MLGVQSVQQVVRESRESATIMAAESWVFGIFISVIQI